MFDKAMQKALAEDGEKLRQLTGEDHGPHFLSDGDRELREKWTTYEAFVRETAIFKANLGIIYCALKLNGECGEVADKVRQIVFDYGLYSDRFMLSHLEESARKAVLLELGDALWYVTALAGQLGYSLVGLHDQADYGQSDGPEGVQVLCATMRLNAGAGLLAEIVGKFVRDKDVGFAPEAYRYDNNGETAAKIAKKLCEIIGTIETLADLYGFSLFDVINANVKKLESRRARGVLKGEGDNR